MSRPLVAIALGDPAGIGPEIAIKSALDARVRDLCVPVLVGDIASATLHAEKCGIDVSFNVIDDASCAASATGHGITFLHRDLLEGQLLQLGHVSAVYGRAALGAAQAAIDAALAGSVAAVVACPQNETAIKKAGIEFDGYPTFVAHCTGTPRDDAFLMICFDDKRIVHTTLHVSLRRAIELIDASRVFRVISVTHSTLRRTGVPSPRIAVSGLNPHAGEGGLFGSEDEEVIAPAVERARRAGIDVSGPFAADLMLQQTGFDAFVVMIHDQGHIAAKLLAPRRTAGMTIGTPVLFCSVAHGTAMDIAGQNKASPAAVIAAIERVTSASAATYS